MHHRRVTVFWTLSHVTIDLKQLVNPLVWLMLSGGKILDHHCLSSSDNKGSSIPMHWSLTAECPYHTWIPPSNSCSVPDTKIFQRVESNGSPHGQIAKDWDYYFRTSKICMEGEHLKHKVLDEIFLVVPLELNRLMLLKGVVNSWREKID